VHLKFQGIKFNQIANQYKDLEYVPLYSYLAGFKEKLENNLRYWQV